MTFPEKYELMAKPLGGFRTSWYDVPLAWFHALTIAFHSGTSRQHNLKTGAEQYYVMDMFSLSQLRTKEIHVQTCYIHIFGSGIS